MDIDKIRNRAMFPQADLATNPAPPEGEALKSFEAAYLSDQYLHRGDPGFDERLERCIELQYTRWQWANDNLETYVNMLRVSGHPDAKIDAMMRYGVPMSFASVEEYGLFKFALLKLRDELERGGTALCNVGFAHTGSSVPGFSTNPLKGFAELPSKITAVGQSDVDLVFIADNVVRSVEAMTAEGRSIWTYSTTMADRSEELRYSVKQEDIEHLSPRTYRFIKLWEEKLGAGIQVTFQETPKAALSPWENRVQLLVGSAP